MSSTQILFQKQIQADDIQKVERLVEKIHFLFCCKFSDKKNTLPRTAQKAYLQRKKVQKIVNQTINHKVSYLTSHKKLVLLFWQYYYEDEDGKISSCVTFTLIGG